MWGVLPHHKGALCSVPLALFLRIFLGITVKADVDAGAGIVRQIAQGLQFQQTDQRRMFGIDGDKLIKQFYKII